MGSEGQETRRIVAGRYRLETELGGGSFGRVFRASDLRFQPPRVVAVKLLREQYANDPVIRSQFEQEASSLAAFNHPNILTIYDFGLSGEEAYIVTPLAERGSLADVLRKQGRLPLEDAGRYLEQMADAIEYAHSRKGVIHRDLKPQNILLDENGRLLVADLGLARIVEGSSSAMLTDVSSGTPAYMAPEQWQGHVGRPNDIYALGVILFEMLTGNRPYRGTQYELMGQHLNSPIPQVTAIAPDLPAGLNPIIEQALAKDPKDRPRHATELTRLFREAVQETPKPNSSITSSSFSKYETATTPIPSTPPTPLPVVSNPSTPSVEATEVASPPPATPPPPSPVVASSAAPALKPAARRLNRKWLYVGLGIGVVAIIAVTALIVILAQPSASSDSSRLVFNPRLLTTLHSPKGKVTNVDFDRGSGYFFSASSDQKLRFWDSATSKDEEAGTILTLQANTPHPIVNNSSSRVLAVGDGNRIILYDLDNGKELTPISGLSATVTGLAFLPEGRTLLAADNNGEVHFWNVSTGQEARPVLKTGQTGAQVIAVSSGGSYLMSGDSTGRVMFYDLENQKELASSNAHSKAVTGVDFSLSNSPPGSVSEDQLIIAWDTTSFKAKNSLKTTSPILALAVSPDSQTFATGSQDGVVRIINNLDGKVLAELKGHTDAVLTLSYSPDGSLLISGSSDNTIKIWKVYA